VATLRASAGDAHELWSAPADALLQRCGTSRDGLSLAEAARRFARHGPNTIDGPRGHRGWRLVPAQVKSPIILVLVAATVASMLLDKSLDVVADGVELGRRTFVNTLTYVRVTVSANFGNMLSMAFVVLRGAFGADATAFRSAWFVKSLMTEVVALLVLRTRRPVFRSVPGRALAWASAAVGVVGLVLPFSPLAAPSACRDSARR